MRTPTSLRAACVALATAVLLAVAACRGVVIDGEIPPPSHPMPTEGIHVGAACVVDITPYPGFPTGGHSLGGAVGRGVWTRLRARTVYVEDEGGSCLVLCACDLWSMSGSLTDRVAEIVARDARGARIPRERLVVAATHTHQSPAGFSGHAVYAQNAACLAGFDPALHEFLARRIARSVLDAAAQADATPGTLSWGVGFVDGVRRNRSLDAFQLDPDAKPASFADPSVDPRVRTLVARDQSGGLVGVAAFTALHPTAMRPETEVYSADVFGVAVVEAQERLAADGRRPVVALFNGAEGDVSPDWKVQDRPETLRIGRGIGKAIADVTRGAILLSECRIAGAFDVVPLGGQTWTEAGVTHATADNPVPGVATLGGAEDGRTVFHDLGWTEGVRGHRLQRDPNRGQGVKRPAFEPQIDLPGLSPVAAWLMGDLTAAIGPPETFPAQVPLGVYRVGPLVFGTLPGEFTTVMGRRVAAGLAAATGAAEDRVHLVGLAGEYVSYFATPEEYEAQHYEGASTLYGPESGPWIAHELAALAGATTADVARDGAVAYRYHTSPKRSFGRETLGERPLRYDDGLEPVIAGDDHVPRRLLPHAEWTDAPFAFPDDPAESAMPFVRVLDENGAVVADSDGVDLLTVALECDETSSRWTAVWMPSPGTPAGRYRFDVRRRGRPAFQQDVELRAATR